MKTKCEGSMWGVIKIDRRRKEKAKRRFDARKKNYNAVVRTCVAYEWGVVDKGA